MNINVSDYSKFSFWIGVLVGLLYGFMYMCFGMIMMMSQSSKNPSDSSGIIMMATGLCLVFLTPLLSYVSAAIMTWIGNIILRKIGGMRFTLKESQVEQTTVAPTSAV